jgi:hypothetical protein
MRRRILLLTFAALVASTVLAGPAHAGNAKQCDRSGSNADSAEARCCLKKGDSNKAELKCIKRNN